MKSKWVGESEDNLRQIFHKARQSAPSIIVFDELDSFASARGTYTGCGVEHSMVNQLLTEMDGFHSEEMVFVVGTTNFVEILDPALLRPGRFEFHLHIPYPDADDRREILKIYDKKMAPEDVAGDAGLRGQAHRLARSRRRSRHAIQRRPPQRPVPGHRPPPPARQPHRRDDAGRHRAGADGVGRAGEPDAARGTGGRHARGRPRRLCAVLPARAAIERIALADDVVGALGYVRHQETKHRNVRMRNQMLADLCVLMGGREAELLLLDDLTWGASQDLVQATAMARDMVEVFGMGGDDVGAMRYRALDDHNKRHADLSPSHLEALDKRVRELLEDARQQAAVILKENRAVVEMLRDQLIEKKVIEAATLKEMLAAKPEGEKKPRKSAKAESA